MVDVIYDISDICGRTTHMILVECLSGKVAYLTKSDGASMSFPLKGLKTRMSRELIKDFFGADPDKLIKEINKAEAAK